MFKVQNHRHILMGKWHRSSSTRAKLSRTLWTLCVWRKICRRQCISRRYSAVGTSEESNFGWNFISLFLIWIFCVLSRIHIIQECIQWLYITCVQNKQVDSLPAEPQGKPKNTGVGSLFLLQQIFLTQALNRGLLHCRQIFYQLSYQGSPKREEMFVK